MEEQDLTEKMVVDTVENGTIPMVHIAPVGQFTGSDAEGNPVPENLTVESLQKLADGLNMTNTEVLADIDHGAAKAGVNKNTAAAGWFTRFIVDPIKGLFANLKLTKKGKELLENREYRFISPTFTLDEKGQPVDLHTASLTNLPAFAGFIEPVLNQEATQISEDKGTINMEMTKEQLVDLIKETVKSMKAAEEKAEEVKETVEEVKEEKTEETTETAENGCQDTEEKVENACSEEKAKNEEAVEEVKEEVKEEAKAEDKAEKEEIDEKEEVIKIEALNTSPTALKSIDSKDWMSLHGKEFFDYLAKHPEIKG